jgi:hypothetical protein
MTDKVIGFPPQRPKVVGGEGSNETSDPLSQSYSYLITLQNGEKYYATGYLVATPSFFAVSDGEDGVFQFLCPVNNLLCVEMDEELEL